MKDKSAKSMGTILLKDTKPLTIDDFFDRIFYRKKQRIYHAMKLFEAIKDGSINTTSFQEMCKKLNITVGVYYDILRAFKRLGIIYKTDGEIHLSGGFLTRLEDMIDLYENLTKFRCKWKR